MRNFIVLFSLLLFFSSCTSITITGKEFYDLHFGSGTPETEMTLNNFISSKQSIKVTGLIFHDWAYPDRESLALLKNSEGERFLEMELDYRSRKYHGLKFRVDYNHNYENDLHRSGPKIIGFIKQSDTSTVDKVKQLYVSKDIVSIKGYYIGIMPSAVWDKEKGQVIEDDMPAFIIESISS